MIAEHPADRAVRLRDRSAVPAEDQAAFDAILTAFDRHEAGDDEGARDAMAAVALGSPFLEWKVLLRGLMAYTAGDDDRARANLERLDPTRLPARLAAPVRALIDPAFRQNCSEEVRNQADALIGDKLTTGLRQLRVELGRGKSLRTAFRKLETILPLLSAQAPSLIPRLATCFYRAILTHGEETDLALYRKVFGPPPDDPDFHRLQALVFEDSENIAAVAKEWKAYERWLSASQPPWPAEATSRARAILLHRLGILASKDCDSPPEQLAELILMSRGMLQMPPRPPSDPTPLWRQAIDLAPDWEAPARELFRWYVDQDQPQKAEAVARRLLERQPQAFEMMDELADLLLMNGRAPESLALRKQLLAVHPLDRTNRVVTAAAYVAAARRHLIDRDPTQAMAVLDEGDRICREGTPAGYLAFRSVVARALKRTDEADALEAQALAVPYGRLAVLLILSVDSGLARLRPADRKRLDQALAEAFKGSAMPTEVSLLYAVWDQYQAEGITYRGQKTQEKKIRDLILQSTHSNAPASDFENLARMCLQRGDYKFVMKLAGSLRSKFPTNPVFPLLEAEAALTQGSSMLGLRKISALLVVASTLAQRSPDPRHKEVIERAQELQKRYLDVPFFSLFR